MKVTSIKHLAFLLKCKSSDDELIKIAHLLSNKQFIYDKQFYREKKEVSQFKNGKLKTRILNPSTGRIKLIQARIKKNILEKIDFPKFVQGGIKGFSNITNSSLHLGHKYKFTSDIKRFFPSIKPKQVYNSLCEFGFKPEVSRIVTILCTYKGRLPQGSSTSSHLANLVFLSIDDKIYQFANKYEITYTRYIDDITLSSIKDFKHLLPSIVKFIQENSFNISSRKTQYRNVLEITGIMTGNNVLNPNIKFFKKLQEDQSENSKIARLNYMNRVKSTKKWKSKQKDI